MALVLCVFVETVIFDWLIDLLNNIDLCDED